MTDNMTNQQSDTSEITTKLTMKKRNRSDLIGRTQLSLSSFWGLEPSLAQKPEPSLAQMQAEMDIAAQHTGPLPQRSLRLPPVLPTTEKTYAQGAHFAESTEAALRMQDQTEKDTDARLLIASLIPPPLKQSGVEKSKGFANLRILYLITFIVMLCVIVTGILTYNMMGAGKNNSPVQPGNPNKSGNLNTQNGMNGQMIASPMQATQQVNGDMVPSGSKSLQVGVAPLVTIQEYSGNVTIHTGVAGSMLINGTDGQDAAPIRVTQVQGKQGRDAITITPEPISKHVNYDVTVPGSTQVQIVIASGSIAIDGVNQVSIDTTSGNLVVKDVNGPVRAHTQNGDITVQNITGPMDLVTVNGSIKANMVHGQMKAMTQNGDIILQQAALSGQSSMKTKYGSVRFTGTMDVRGKYTLGTISGDVELTLPMGAAFQLYANTRTGGISNEFGSNTTGSAPYAQIIASTQSGSVRVHQV